MKKNLVLAAVLASVVTLSCEEAGYSDIEVVNYCEWPIQVCIIIGPKIDDLGSSSFVYIVPRMSRRFKHLENGNYTLYIMPKDPYSYHNPTDPNATLEASYNSMVIDKYDTWIIEWAEPNVYRVRYTSGTSSST